MDTHETLLLIWVTTQARSLPAPTSASKVTWDQGAQLHSLTLTLPVAPFAPHLDGGFSTGQHLTDPELFFLCLPLVQDAPSPALSLENIPGRTQA